MFIQSKCQAKKFLLEFNKNKFDFKIEGTNNTKFNICKLFHQQFHKSEVFHMVTHLQCSLENFLKKTWVNYQGKTPSKKNKPHTHTTTLQD